VDTGAVFDDLDLDMDDDVFGAQPNAGGNEESSKKEPE
jgi:hypothetical protein